MPLRDLIATAIDSAWVALDDIPESSTLSRIGTSTYDPTTGLYTNSTTTYTGIPIIYTRFEEFQIDKVNILSTDTKALVKQNSLTITPNQSTDKIIRGSRTYNIIRVTEDPAGAIYTLQLRSV